MEAFTVDTIEKLFRGVNSKDMDAIRRIYPHWQIQAIFIIDTWFYTGVPFSF